MIQTTNYTFPVSLSKESFINKEISGAMIGTSKDENNRKIREAYGYSRGISFYRTDVTPNQLLQELLEGRVFCHLFNPTKTRNDGTFGSCEKTNNNFAGSYVIGVDIDKTEYNTAREYVATLTNKPTFYYTSYSNKQMGKGARFRLIYVFDELITNPYYFRYAASLLNQSIEHDTKEAIEDNCNLRCSQYFNGTCRYNSSVVLDWDITNTVYSLRDFGITEDGFRQFLKGGANYRTLTRDRKEEMRHILNSIEESPTESTTEPNKASLEPVCSPYLVEDMKTLDYDEFMRKHRRNYTYSYRMETGNWIDGIYQQVEDGYFSLYWNVEKVKDGQKRRKKLFERICLRRVLNPTIDADTLLFNAFEDRYRFFEIDKDLDIDCLVRNVETALELEIEDIETMYSENLAYLRGKKKPKSLIFKSGEYTSKADLKAVNRAIIQEHYNPNLTVQENYSNISKIANLSIKTLYRYCSEKGIRLKLTDNEIIELLDPNLSSRANETKLRESGVKVDRNRVVRLLRVMRE